MDIVIYTDGAARGNPGPAGAGGIVKIRNTLIETCEYLGEQTNNAAEYMALILNLEKALSLKSDNLEIFADSELMVQQLKGVFKVKNSGLSPLYRRAKYLMGQFPNVEINYIPREHNKSADKLANIAIDEYIAGKREPIKLSGIDEQASLF